ncbi:MAG: helix-turn-helix transcriptional regulator [Nibricoccus sp.]
MHYTQLFRALREARGLTHEGLARKATCHRNTVINVESGRPVKFKTIAELMSVMGYGHDSAELKSIALLWLESVSGVNLTSEQSTDEARRKIDRYRATEQEAAQLLADSVIAEHLSVDQIRTLLFASGRPEIIAILDNIRDLVGQPVDEDRPAPELEVAEGS